MNTQLVSSSQAFSRWASGVVIAIGLLVLIGWLFDLPAPKSIVPGLATMKANSAIAFVLAGVTLWQVTREQKDWRTDLLIRICAAIVTLIGLLTLGQYIFDRNFGIDQLLFKDEITPQNIYPGRISPVTALNFSLLGFALLLLSGTQYHQLIPAFTISALLTSALALIGYAYRVPSLYQIFPYSSVAIHTALALSILSLGILCARPDAGLMKILNSDDPGGAMARRLLPAALILPIFLGWLLLTGERMGFYDNIYRLVLFATSTAIIFSNLILWNARMLSRMEVERGQIEKALSLSERRAQALLENSWDAIALFGADGTILYGSPSTPQILGYTLVEFVGRNAFELIHPEDQAAVTERLKLSLQQPGRHISVEARVRHRNGQWRWLEGVFTNLLHEPSVGAIVNNYHDFTERKRAEEINKGNQERFRLIVEVAPSAIIAVDRDGKIDLVNAKAQDLFGYREEELLGHPVEMLVPNRFHNLHAKYRQNFLVQPTSRPMGAGRDLYGVHKDGHEIPIEIGLTPYESSQGLFTLALIVDITERKHAEEQIAYQAYMLENVNDAVIGSDENSVIRFWNQGAERIFGWKAEEVLGRSAREILRSEIIDSDRETVFKILAEQGRWTGEAALYRKDGSQVIMEVSSITLRDATGLITGYVSVNRDITDRRQTQAEIRKLNTELEQRVAERTAALSQANSLLQMLLDHMPDQIYFKDVQSRFIRNSRSQARALGLSDPAEAVGKSDFDFFPHAQESFEKEQEIIQSGKPLVDQEEFVVWPDGSASWVSTTKVPLRDQNDKIIGTFGISRDITGRKQTELEIQKAKLELEAANKELEAFSYSVSHDLRAPLRSVDGFSQALLEDYGDVLPSEGRDFLERIRNSTQRMGQLIDDLLNLSRVTRAPLKTGAVDLSKLAENIAVELKRQDKARTVNFVIAQNLNASGDPRLLQIVLENLMSNAWKFTSKREVGEIEVGSRDENGETVFYIRDNGAGFDMAYVNKLFGAFQRLHAMTEFPGTGVGLATIQRIIHRHGGRVWAEGIVDQGATFFFTLPVFVGTKPAQSAIEEEVESLHKRAKEII